MIGFGVFGGDFWIEWWWEVVGSFILVLFMMREWLWIGGLFIWVLVFL